MTEVDRLREDLKIWRKLGYEMPYAVIGDERRLGVARDLGVHPSSDVVVDGVTIIGAPWSFH